MKSVFDFDSRLLEAAAQAEKDASAQFSEIDAVSQHCTAKVLRAFQSQKISAACFAGANGYGYDDIGRDQLDRVWAEVFHTEDALVRHHFVSGTHALSTALFGVLRPGDRMVSVTGAPYDTLEEVIGIRGSGSGSLRDFGVQYAQADLTAEGLPDYDAIPEAVRGARVVYLQRSRGYSLRPALSVADIRRIAELTRQVNPDAVIMVDNCYGEFVEKIEPTDVGADLCVGSLIKNPGGGLAPCGGYIVGKKEYVEQCAYRLTSPGLGKEVGASLGLNRNFFQGLFFAPTVTAGALKGAVFAANLYERLGFKVVPNGTESRHDIIQAVTLGSAEGLIAFCKGIQAAAPVDSYVTPEPWAMPGYQSDVIMAAGAFYQGSSIELSADGPLIPPYNVYFQGGLTWYHAKLGILMSLEEMARAGCVSL